MNRVQLVSIYIFLAVLLAARIIFTVPGTITTPDSTTIAAGTVRSRLVSISDLVFQPKTAALVNGVLWGDKTSFSQKDWALLKASGLTHIAVASGMNLVLLTGVLSLVLPKKRKINISISLLIASIYTFITGFQSPIMRALVMLIVSYLGGLTGRPSGRFAGLVVAGYAILMQSPDQLTSVSFQLSFLATAGQLMISTFSAKILVLNRFIISDLTQTIMAQLLTLPITAVVFGKYALASILVNALVLWSVSWIMIFGAVAGFVGAIFLPLGRLLALPLEGLSFYFWQVVGYFGSQTWSLARTPQIDLTACIPYYLLIIGGYLWVRRRLASG